MAFYGSLGERSRLRCRQPNYATGLCETLWGRTSHQFDGDRLTTNGGCRPTTRGITNEINGMGFEGVVGQLQDPEVCFDRS